MENSAKVLIVEDEPNALMGLAELISGWGYRTETARWRRGMGEGGGLESGHCHHRLEDAADGWNRAFDQADRSRIGARRESDGGGADRHGID